MSARLYILLISISCFFSACTSTSNLTETVVPLEISIALQKTMCYGTCPAYNFQALNDGRATLTIGRFAEDVMGRTLDRGNYSGIILETDILRILSLASSLNYFELLEIYDDEMLMDLPAAISTINGHTVFNRYDGPDLDELYTEIEKLMASTDWIADSDTER